MCHVLHYLCAQKVSNTTAKGASFATWKAAVQVASVRQVTGAVHKSKDVHDGHGDQGSAQIAKRRIGEHTAHNFHTSDLITMYGATHHEYRAIAAPMYNFHGYMQRRVGIKLRNWNFHLLPGTRLYLHSSHLKGRSRHRLSSAFGFGAPGRLVFFNPVQNHARYVFACSAFYAFQSR